MTNRTFAAYDAAIEARVRASETFIVNRVGLGEPDNLRACILGTVTAMHKNALDNVWHAKMALRDGNVSSAMMFLDMIEDPMETKP